jgi:hypothetical protein
MLFYYKVKDGNEMKRMMVALIAAGVLTILFSGCAENNYNTGYSSYDTRSSYDKKMDDEVQKDADEASKMLSAQDIKNIENMKK